MKASNKVSSEDVARKAGVSRTTVSFVLNNTPGKNISEETRERVLEVARELAYVPNELARSIAMIKHHSIGFFVPHTGYLSSDAYVLRVIEGMIPVLNKNRFKLVLQPLKLEQQNYLQLARKDNIDGIILMNTHDDDAGLAEIIEARFPLVVIGTLTNQDVCQIDINNRSAASTAVDYLIGLGHQDIGMIVQGPMSYFAARDRFEGFRDAMEASHLTVKKKWVREANLSEESGHQAMSEILSAKQRPTAVFCGNDVVAYGAMQAIADAGLSIPDDISLVGFDDDRLSRHVNPPLTTMATPATGLGAEAVRTLISILNGLEMPNSLALLRTSLSVRNSCRRV
jgi:LacI family transcriptional regulator